MGRALSDAAGPFAKCARHTQKARLTAGLGFTESVYLVAAATGPPGAVNPVMGLP